MERLQTKDIYNKYTKEYIDRFMGLELYADTFDYLLGCIPFGANVLELGCGPGNVIKYMRSKRGDLGFLGIDIAPEMIKEAKRQNPGVGFQMRDIKEVAWLKQQFDVVIAAFCLPYLPAEDVHAFFQNIDSISASNTLLYLSFMEGSPQRSGWEKTSFTGEDEVFINYYERERIEALLKKHHFDIARFFSKDYPEMDGSSTTDLIYVAKKSVSG